MKKYIRMIGLIGLLILLTAGCGAKAEPEKPEEPAETAPDWQEEYDRGVEYLEESEYRKAIRSLEDAIELDPTEAEAYLALSEAYLAQEEPEEAEACLRDGLKAAAETEALEAALAALTPPEPEAPQPETQISEPAQPERPEPEEPEPEPEEPPAAVSLMSAEEIEEEVLRIREVYNGIAGNLNTIPSQTADEYTTCWRKDGNLVCIMVAAGGHGSSLSRSYYFENGQLIFAYLEGEESYRLYFRDGAMFRMRHTPDKDDPDAAVNYDQVVSGDYLYWQGFALSDCERVFQTLAAG